MTQQELFDLMYPYFGFSGPELIALKDSKTLGESARAEAQYRSTPKVRAAFGLTGKAQVRPPVPKIAKAPKAPKAPAAKAPKPARGTADFWTDELRAEAKRVFKDAFDAAPDHKQTAGWAARNALVKQVSELHKIASA